jgi:diguanylate cyclase (GGDEF)-like protein/PAS domain S-box-containing protein
MIGKPNTDSIAQSLFREQLAKATDKSSQLDLQALGELVISAYEEADCDRRRIRDSMTSLMQERDDLRQQFVDAIEILPEGIVLFDAEDRFVLWNQRYAEMYGASADLIGVGRRFEDVLRAALKRGQFAEAIGREEDWLRERLARHCEPSSAHEFRLAADRWVRIEERRTASGGSVGVRIDITGSRKREDELREQKLQTEIAINNMSQGLLLYDAQARITVCNRRYIEMYGLSPDVVRPGRSFRDVIQHRKDTGSFHGDVDQYCQDVQAQVSRGKTAEILFKNRDGRTTRIVNRPVTGGGWVATHEDVTEHQRLLQEQQAAQDLVRQQKLQLDVALNNMMQGLCVFDADGRIVLCNPRYMQMMELPAEQLIGVSLLDVCKRRKATGQFLGDPEAFFNEVLANARAGRSATKIMVRNDGRALRVVDQPMANGGWVATFEDITEQRKIEQERDRDRAFLNQIIDNVPTMIAVKDASNRRFVLANRAAENLWGFTRGEAIGKTARELFPPAQAELIDFHDDEALRADAPLVLEAHPNMARSGDMRVVASKRLAIRDTEGKAQYLVSVVEDVTERTRANERIAHMAHYDALTDLPNRVLFREHLEQSLKWIRRGQRLAVLYLDIDQFKNVNDTLGHPVGDELLKAVAARLRSCLRETDIIARLGGDEFAIIQTAVDDPDEVSSLAKRIHQSISAPFDLSGHQFVTNTSIGIALAPHDGLDPDQLLKNADLAMYGAKADGRGTYRFFEPAMDARIKARRALEFELREAIMCGGFELYYQPLYKIHDRTMSGCEALIRWRHPKRGLVSPAEFIPIAEDSGLIVQLGEWVLRTACTEAAKWPSDIRVAVNVSPVQFMSGNIIQIVINALAASRLPARRLELEITEAVLIRDDEKVLAVLHRLRDLGVRIAMDDFGTGYSSLSYLQRFPFDKIKIDRSFIKDIAEPEGSLAIVQAVVSIAQSRNITTTAEGVETAGQLEVLHAIGCNEMQGFLFSPPRQADELPQLFCMTGDKLSAVA